MKDDIYKLLEILKKWEINLSTYRFMTPILLTWILSAYRQEKLNIKWIDNAHIHNPDLYWYMTHCWFLDYLMFENISPQLDYKNLIPLSHIHENIDPTITDQLAEKITDNKEVAYSFSFILRELLDNTIRHSKADFDELACYYMLQKYPANNTVHICIADNWIWIRKSLENKFNLDTDLDYIVKAFEKWVTSRWKAGWNWLFFTKEIVKNSWSKLYYWSWDFIYIIKDWEEFYINTKKYWLSWQGILLDIELNLNNINSELMQKIWINVKEELDNMEDDMFI